MTGCDQGNAEAQWRLGYCYYVGKGIREDKREAVKWYRLAAGQGNAEAQWRLGYCYYVGKGIREDKREAVKMCIRDSPMRTRTPKYGTRIRCVTDYTIGLCNGRFCSAGALKRKRLFFEMCIRDNLFSADPLKAHMMERKYI